MFVVRQVRIKYIIWNRDSTLVALLGKHTLVLANRNLEQQCSITETVRSTQIEAPASHSEID